MSTESTSTEQYDLFNQPQHYQPESNQAAAIGFSDASQEDLDALNRSTRRLLALMQDGQWRSGLELIEATKVLSATRRLREARGAGFEIEMRGSGRHIQYRWTGRRKCISTNE